MHFTPLLCLWLWQLLVMNGMGAALVHRGTLCTCKPDRCRGRTCFTPSFPAQSASAGTKTQSALHIYSCEQPRFCSPRSLHRHARKNC